MSWTNDQYGPRDEMSPAEENATWREYVTTRSEASRDRLIEHYIPLAYSAAERMARQLPSFIDAGDLVGMASMGLIEAIKGFDPSVGVKFSTFCSLRLRGAIVDELRKLDHVPRGVRALVKKLDRAGSELISSLGREPSPEELAEKMGVTPEKLEVALQAAQIRHMVSFDKAWDGDEVQEHTQIETIADERATDPHEEAIRAEIKEVAIKGLSDNQKLVVAMYYYDNLSLKEIGSVLGLSESRVCQIHAEVLKMLKEKFRMRGGYAETNT